MSIIKWKKGRLDNVKYYKSKLWEFKFLGMGFDAYVLKYPVGTFLIPHKDEVKNGNHYRLNLSLKGKSIFDSESYIFKSKILNIFRPDLNIHSLFALTKTYKLSLGYVKFKKVIKCRV